ncbi:DUF6334 family protein [Actinocorallia aurantiaca]
MPETFDPRHLGFHRQVCQEAGELESVAHGVHPDLPDSVSAVLLRFRSASWLLDVDLDDDTVQVSEPASADPELVFSDASSTGLWAPALGRPVLWAWILENQQGHTDGLQLSFALDGGAEWRVQLIAAASQWRLSGWGPPESEASGEYDQGSQRHSA